MRIAVVLLAALLASSAALAKDTVRLVDSQAVVYDHFSIHHAQAEGYFAAEVTFVYDPKR